MPRELFIQDIPAGARSVSDIPDEWMPAPLPYSAAEVRETIRAVAPDADFSSPNMIAIELRDPGFQELLHPDNSTITVVKFIYSIVVHVDDTDVLKGFMMEVRGDMVSANAVIVDILRRLSLRAFDTWAEDGEIFPPTT